jgi:hypothetical protein
VHSKEEDLLAYVFWHWRRANVAAEEYEARQRAFQTSMAAARVSGFSGSFSSRLSGAAWAAGGAEAYEDWYLVDGFGAFDALNEAAISSSRAAPHDAAATVAAGGTAGAYALRLGAPVAAPRYAQWFGKPEGMSYRELLHEIAPALPPGRAALWSRQMALGPAPEYCLHTEATVSLPAAFLVLALPLSPVWPVEADRIGAGSAWVRDA